MKRIGLVLLAVFASACWKTGATSCTRDVEAMLKSARGTATEIDGGLIVELSWPADGGVPLSYFKRAEFRADDALGRSSFRRMTVLSSSTAAVEFASVDAGFSFDLSFGDPDLSGVPGCRSFHGGMDDHVVLGVALAAPTDAGTRSVTTKAGIALGAY